jgi:MoaA/NifB/PqqE/SkfB family radical SAM enzyme
MDVSTFSKIASILPLVSDEGFHFSCRFEPTINPNFLELLDIIHESFKNKVFLTTNLARPLSEDFIQKLKQSNIHHINISIETFNPDTYKSLCSGGNFKIFYNNLITLVTIFKESDNSPKIRYITMILKENYDELIDIAIKCHTDFFADSHEFRTPYYYSLNVIDTIWAKNQLLSRRQLDALVSRLKELSFSTCWSMESDEQTITKIKKTQINKKGLKDQDIYAIQELPVPINKHKEMSVNEDYYDLRIESNGTVYFYGTREKYAINEINNPSDFFKNKLNYLFNIEASRFECENYPKYNCKKSLDSKIHIDTFYDAGDFLIITGWAFIENKDGNYLPRGLMIYDNNNNNKKNLFYTIDTISRPDVMEFFNNPSYICSGFKCIIKKIDVEGPSFKLRIIFTPKSFLTLFKPAYFTEYSEELAFDPKSYGNY